MYCFHMLIMFGISNTPQLIVDVDKLSDVDLHVARAKHVVAAKFDHNSTNFLCYTL